MPKISSKDKRKDEENVVTVTVTLQKTLPAGNFDIFKNDDKKFVPANASEVVEVLTSGDDPWSDSWNFIEWADDDTVEWDIEVIDVVS